MINYVHGLGEPCQFYPGLEHHLHQHPFGKFSSLTSIIRPCSLFCIFFGGLECVGHSFDYVAH
jgi:hypothetical protein